MSQQPAQNRNLLAKSFGVALMLLMTVPLFAGSAEAVLGYTSSAQDTQIAKDWGVGAPFGTWQKLQGSEPATFYFHGRQGCADGGPAGGGTSAPGTPTSCGTAPGVTQAPATTPKWWLDTRAPWIQPVLNPPATPPTNQPQEVLLQNINSFTTATNGNTLDFDNQNCLINGAQALDTTTISSLDFLMYMRGDRVLQDNLRVFVSILKSDCTPKTTNVVIFDAGTSTAASTGDGYSIFTGSWTFPGVTDPTQPYGIIMQKGERLRVAVGLIGAVPTSTATVAFDGQDYRSSFTVHSDSARVNQWTADRFQAVTNHFPHTEVQHPADVGDRTIHWSATEFNTWGHSDELNACADCSTAGTTPSPATPIAGCNVVTVPPSQGLEWPGGNCASDNIDEMAMQLRVKDMTPSHVGYNKYVPLDLRLGLSKFDSQSTLDTSFVGCCDSAFINPMINKVKTSNADRDLGISNYQFNLVYSKDFLDGVYRIELRESHKLWTFSNEFIVGNTGFDFKFQPDEGKMVLEGAYPDLVAEHTVALKEPTKYSLYVKNSGSVTDTFGLAIPVPGSGFTASVTPNTVTLPPGGEAKVDMLVIPPDTAHAGDQKVVSVAATSTVSNIVKTLYTKTTYTADTTPQAPFLTSPQKEVNTRPKLATVFPLVVHNQGPVRDNYVLSGKLDEGTPACPSAGFVVQIDPTFLPVFAQSREAVSVKIVAPAEAPPTCSWTLHFQACRTVNDKLGLLCSPFLDIPVKIFAIDDVQVSVLKDNIVWRDAELDHVTCTDPTPANCMTGNFATVNGYDTSFDDGAMYRVLVENKGDRTDKIELTGSWVPKAEQPAGEQDAGECEGTAPNTGDGVPDGWRYQFFPFKPQGGSPGTPVDPGMTYPQPLPAGAPVAPRFSTDIPSYDGSPTRTGAQINSAPQFGAGHTSTFAGEARFGWLTLPAHTSQFVFLDLSWQDPGIPNDYNGNNAVDPGCAREPGCSGFVGWPQNPCNNYRNSMPSPAARFRLSYRSGNDDSIRGSHDLTATLLYSKTLIGANDGIDHNPGHMLHSVAVELAPGQPDVGLANIDPASTAQYATYNIVATNTGNEYDDMTISVDDGHNGWKHSVRPLPVPQSLPGPINLQSSGIIPSGQTLTAPTSDPPSTAVGGNAPPRTSRDCKITDTASQIMLCHSIGVGDTIYVQIIAKPPSGAAVGSYDDMAVTVNSERAYLMNPAPQTGGVAKHITVRSFVQGIFGFALLHPNDSLTGYRGQTIAFPFTIKNVGTTNDVYSVAVDKADAAHYAGWNPQLSSSQLVAVPAGYDYHGFVSMTVPTDPTASPITDPLFFQGDTPPAVQPMRLDIQSVAGFGQTGVLDFFPLVTETPAITMSADPTTITSVATSNHENEGRIRLTAHATGTTVMFTGYYQTAPATASSTSQAPGSGGQPDLPPGFKFVCLPSTHVDWDVQRKCYDPYPPQNQAACTGCTEPWRVQPFFSSDQKAIQQLEISAPPKQLGDSRIAQRIQGSVNACIVTTDNKNTNGCDFTYTDAIINMASVYGVKLTAVPSLNDPPSAKADKKFIPPGAPGGTGTAGGSVLFDVVVQNKGLSPQSVLLTNSPLPDGWQIFYDSSSVQVQPPGYPLANGPSDCPLVGPACASVNPASNVTVQVGIVAPPPCAVPEVKPCATEGAQAIVEIFGTVQEDTTKRAELQLTAVVGSYAPKIKAGPATEWVAPQETARFPVLVENTGELPDIVQVQAFLPTTVTDTFPTSWSGCTPLSDKRMPVIPAPAIGDVPTCYVVLDPHQTAPDIRLDVGTPDQVYPTGTGPGYTVRISAHSVFRPGATDSQTTTIKILDYRAADIDGDRLMEYAVDGCTATSSDAPCEPNSSDGFETFRENLQVAGTVTQDLRGETELRQFLSTQGLADHTDATGFHYKVDLDFDKRTDHLLDTNGDGLPDVAWIPSTGVFEKLGESAKGTFIRDVTADGQFDYFIDLELDGRPDVVYDLTLGKAIPLIQRYVDGDQYVDYVVDINGNNVVDQNDTVLFGGPNGAITHIQYSADVNGDGLVDKAIDTDGDGLPDYFLPAAADGSTPPSIALILKDVTGDGKPDWTYDHTGQNGRPDSYYDPVCKCAGAIDTKGEFLRDLEHYWFIGLLFLLALALFVVLVVVTRKR